MPAGFPPDRYVKDLCCRAFAFVNMNIVPYFGASMGGGKFASLALLRNSTPFSCARDALSLAREFVKCCAIAIAGLQNSKTPRNESKTRGLRLGDRVPEIKTPGV